MAVYMAATYEEAVDAVRQYGILPLSDVIPDHPSLVSITPPHQWHNGQANDPWLWRDRFAAEGAAAYGRFFAKKPILVCSDWFPAFRQAMGDDRPLPAYAPLLYETIRDNPGIDMKHLRRFTGLDEKGAKPAFDKALIALQHTGAVVISGIDERLNEHGVKSGWNGTCYMTSEYWMERHQLQAFSGTKPEAKDWLLRQISACLSESAARYLATILTVR